MKFLAFTTSRKNIKEYIEGNLKIENIAIQVNDHKYIDGEISTESLELQVIDINELQELIKIKHRFIIEQIEIDKVVFVDSNELLDFVKKDLISQDINYTLEIYDDYKE